MVSAGKQRKGTVTTVMTEAYIYRGLSPSDINNGRSRPVDFLFTMNNDLFRWNPPETAQVKTKYLSHHVRLR